MNKIKTLDLDIPDDMEHGWQNIVDLLAQITQVPAALIMRVHSNYIEVSPPVIARTTLTIKVTQKS